MIISDFTIDHIEEAAQLAKENYEEERRYVPALPPVDTFPNLAGFAKNGLGVAAFDDGKMVGYLCSYPPFKNAFRSTDAIGIFSPIHGNGTVPENRGRIYARMYQASGEKWAAAGASSHAVCLYAHDTAAQEQFFRYGFGMRCIDAIRPMEEPDIPICSGYTFTELKKEEYPLVYPLDCMLTRHYVASPTFMKRHIDSMEEFMEMIEEDQPRFFATKKNDTIAAFIKIGGSGETFICKTPGMANVCGAFCLPEHRGAGVYQSLLGHTVHVLKAEGYTRLGVDFESINPTANGFWLKHFTAYTHSVVRRIDEHVLR